MGLVARVLEERGLPTVLVSTGRDLTAQVMPPRSVFVNFPMGNPFGRAFDVSMQRRILLDALNLVVQAQTAGVLIDLPYVWDEPFAALVDKATASMSPK